jgi:hypothetical protein
LKEKPDRFSPLPFVGEGSKRGEKPDCTAPAPRCKGPLQMA